MSVYIFKKEFYIFLLGILILFKGVIGHCDEGGVDTNQSGVTVWITNNSGGPVMISQVDGGSQITGDGNYKGQEVDSTFDPHGFLGALNGLPAGDVPPINGSKGAASDQDNYNLDAVTTGISGPDGMYQAFGSVDASDIGYWNQANHSDGSRTSTQYAVGGLLSNGNSAGFFSPNEHCITLAIYNDQGVVYLVGENMGSYGGYKQCSSIAPPYTKDFIPGSYSSLTMLQATFSPDSYNIPLSALPSGSGGYLYGDSAALKNINQFFVVVSAGPLSTGLNGSGNCTSIRIKSTVDPLSSPSYCMSLVVYLTIPPAGIQSTSPIGAFAQS